MTWANVGNRWPSRIAAVAELVPPGASVLDIGAGAQALRDALPPSCRYTPADLHQRTPETLVIDLNAGTGWPSEAYDCAVLAGVLEYVDRPADVLAHLRAVAGRAVVTYLHGSEREPTFRNDLTEDEFAEMAAEAGWTARHEATWTWLGYEPQAIWVLS